MKRALLSLILVAMLPAIALADHVESARAQKAAKTFMNNNGIAAAQLIDISAEAGFSNLYIYNADKGFVVMAADDRVQPILGYSLTGHFRVKGMPSNVRGWLQGYNDEIQFAVENNAKASSETKQQWHDLENGVKGTKATVVVEPLLYTQWDQGDPYYNLCPTATSGGTTYHAVTGCVATAMAQIMKYWNWPIKGNGSHSYRPSGFSQQSVNFGNTTYDWANMTDTYDSNSTEAEETAVATLMYHCGVSVDMQYGLEASGAQSSAIPTALKNYFRYNTSVAIKYKTNYNNNSWANLIKGELDALRPVQYSGNDGSEGHAFVCDGYRSDDYFHFNWGWSGMYDGYFTLNTLNPGTGGTGSGSGNYNQGQSAVINAYPTYAISSAPTLTVTLTQNQTTRNANLSWTSVSNASSYQVFRNRKLIATTTSRTYTDVNAPYGNNKYYVRGVNSSNGISQPSTEVTVAFENPTNLVVTLDDGLFDLSWNSTVLAHSYKIYCNGFNIGSSENASLSFTLGAYGDLEFYVTAVDFNGDESMPSNVVIVSQPYEGPVVTDLEATPGDASATIEWTGLTANEGYGMSHLSDYSGSWYYGVGYSAGLYWAVRFPVSMLSFYHGAAIQSVYTYINEAGTYQVKVYQCTGDVPSGTPIASVSNTYSEAGFQTIDIGGTYYLDTTKDLWIVFYTSGVSYPMLFALYDNGEGDYVSTDGTDWFHLGDYSWRIFAVLTDGTYTYNLYRNGEVVAENLTETSYTDENLPTNAAYKYTVTTNYLGGVSASSNFSELVFGEATHEGNLTMKRNDNLLVLPNGKLTVTGALNNDYPYNLIIRPGAQVVADNPFSGAYLKRVNAYSEGETNDGWYLLSSPVYGETDVEDVINLIPDNAEDYDLYWFDQAGDSEGREWLNYKVEGQQPKWDGGTGRLYANKKGATLAFVGLLNRQPTDGIPVSYESGYNLSGFNLIGNPLTYDAYITNSYYRMNDEGSELIEGTGAIKAGEGVFVQVSEAGNVNFTKTQPRQKKLSITATKASATRDGASAIVDRASVRFDDTNVLAKNMLDRRHTQLCFVQDDKEYAVVGWEEGQNELYLKFKASSNGKYTLCFSAENLDLGYLHLIDNKTGNDVDLLQTSSYTFESHAGDYPSRFKLVFDDGASTGSATFAYFDGNAWNINNEGAATLQVIDVMGRQLFSTEINSSFCIPHSAFNTPGVYMLRLVNGDSVRTQKIVVR